SMARWSTRPRLPPHGGPSNARGEACCNSSRINARGAPMHFYEFEAKRLLAKHGIPIPESRSAETPVEVERAASAIGFPVVLKAQVLSRALARTSGVTPAASPAE